MSRAERIELVEDLWDSLADEKTTEDVSAEKKKELADRRTRFQANPESGLSWDSVKKLARSRHE
ncbi:addiction module protein [Luteolibacter flavescens]|uniref:Addiction module protein n=1 Tax=Luteolibacter flavescens TaxID=1859460 RepID=A0ABT3FTX5_9BACT|nr:addiction module protein [Luteolibacter flavescens]